MSKSPIPGLTSILLPIQTSIRLPCPPPSHPPMPNPASIRFRAPTAATGRAMLSHGSPHQDKGFHTGLPLVFHPCHLFSRPRTRRTQGPGARVECGVVICRPGRHLVGTTQCCMYTPLLWQSPFVGKPQPGRTTLASPLLASTTLHRAQPGPGKQRLMGKCEAISANKTDEKLEPTTSGQFAGFGQIQKRCEI